MTKFKLNARGIGGLGLFLIIGILLVPLYIGVLESGIGDLPSSVIQVEEGARVPLPNNPLAFGIGALVVFFILLFLIRLEMKRRA